MGFFEKMSEKITSTSKEVTQKAKDLAEIAKINSSINSEQSKIKGFYYNIGERYYLEHKDCENDEYQELLTAINTCKESIEKLQNQIDEIKKNSEAAKQAAMKVCSSCGNVLRDDELFCPQCGTKYESNQNINQNTEESPVQQEQSVVSEINLTKDSEDTQSKVSETSEPTNTSVDDSAQENPSEH